MKLWAFYRKPEKYMENMDEREVPIDTKYALYAITADKLCAKAFEGSRNMDLFLKRVIKCDEDDIDEYLIQHRSSQLTWCWLETFRNRNRANQQQCFAHVLLTENELNFTTESVDSGTVLSRIRNFLPIEIFNEEIARYLRDVRYDEVSTMIMMGRGEYPFNGTDEFSYLSVSFDQFAVFMMFYEKTFSEHFFDYVKIQDTPPESR